uniref:PHD-type domain-containing protein n=1 Tax=Cacopsylla melanoneura TaxID=428564 RepID=A0A8D8YZN7_9HEMI
MVCSKCQDPLLEEDTLECSQCKSVCHYVCVAMRADRYRKLGAEKKNWKCNECKTIPPTKKNETFTVPLKNESNEIPKYMKEFMQEIRQLVGEVQKSLEKKFDDMKQKYEEVLEKQKLLEKENSELQKANEMYEVKIDALENRSRMSNIEIRNVPETKDENIENIIKAIGRTIGITDIKDGDIQVAHRVDTMNKERGKRPIIAHLASRYMRNIWIQKFKSYRKDHTKLTANLINTNLQNNIVYINEHITRKLKMVLNDAKSFAREKGIKFVWVKDGYILMKRNEDDRHVQKINCKKELEEYKMKVQNFR